MIQSMTGFAAGQGTDGQYAWSWDLRSVNGKGLDLRLRVPDWIDGLEAAIRARLPKAMARGNVSVALRIQSTDTIAAAQLNPDMLAAVLDAMTDIESHAMERGLSLAPSNAADVLAVRGVFDTVSADPETGALSKALMADFETVLTEFLAMRAKEGDALARVMRDQLETIAQLTEDAAAAAKARQPNLDAQLRQAFSRIVDNSDGLDPARIAQELAVLAVKMDVTEEIDRLRAHLTAASDLIETGSPVGRKLDFLMQEFNREANTLCSKAQNTELTTIGLNLKTVIDQMREQVQNVE